MEKEINILDDFKCELNCDENSCAVRYYLPEKELAVGLLRLMHHQKEGKVPQHVVTIMSMDIEKMIEYIMGTYGINPQYGDDIVHSIRVDCQKKVTEHLKGTIRN